MLRIITVLAVFAAGPALAAETAFFSLKNTDFIVVLAFLLFAGILIYLKVPQILTGLLDKRAAGIRAELDEARGIREEAQSLLASYERKQREVSEQSQRIVDHARVEAGLAAEQAKKDLEASLARRLQAAEEQIASAQSAALREVRDRAVNVAVAAAREVIAKQLTAADANKLIDAAIVDVEAKLH